MALLIRTDWKYFQSQSKIPFFPFQLTGPSQGITVRLITMNAAHSVYSPLTCVSCLWIIVLIFWQLLILSEFYSARSIFIVIYPTHSVTIWEVSSCLHGILPKTKVCTEPEKPLHMHIQAVFLLHQCKPTNVFKNEIRGITLVFNAKHTLNTSWWM